MRDPRTRPHVRQPSEEELRLWRHVVRSVRPLRPEPPEDPANGGAAPAAAGEEARRRGPAPKSHMRPATAARRPCRPEPGPIALDPARPAGIDRRTFQRLRRGRLPVEAHLDLHGMTREEAFFALERFLARMQAAGVRCVLVITGRGTLRGGVLRELLPRWLEAPAVRHRVVAFAPARPEHGGAGAFYLLLRRRRY